MPTPLARKDSTASLVGSLDDGNACLPDQLRNRNAESVLVLDITMAIGPASTARRKRSSARSLSLRFSMTSSPVAHRASGLPWTTALRASDYRPPKPDLGTEKVSAARGLPNSMELPRRNSPYTQIVYGKERSPAGHPGHAGPQDTDPRTAPRLRHRTSAPPALRGHPPRRGGLALPRPAASRTQRLDRGRVGLVLQQPARALLQTHPGGPQGAGRGNGAVSPDDRRDRARHGARMPGAGAALALLAPQRRARPPSARRDGSFISN